MSPNLPHLSIFSLIVDISGARGRVASYSEALRLFGKTASRRCIIYKRYNIMNAEEIFQFAWNFMRRSAGGRSLEARFQVSPCGIARAACRLVLFTLFGCLSTLPFGADAKERWQEPLNNMDYIYDKAAIKDYIGAAVATKGRRAVLAFENVNGLGLRDAFSPHFANLYLGRNLVETNALLFDILTTKDNDVRERHRLNDHWCLTIDQQFYHMYYAFGAKGSVAPGRLHRQTEEALLEVIWERMESKNDIHLTRNSTWWMVGSENHDLVAKVSCLISSQIFMKEPAYSHRVYPDLGMGGGYYYWFHRMYGRGDDDGPEGRAMNKDGKEYTAADHFHAWVRYFDDYFTERAKKGFFLEVASTGYMAVTVSYLTDIFDLCQDRALANKAGRFMDAVWADWAVDQLNGVRGGAKTRANGRVWEDAMYRFARFYFGGEGSAQPNFFTNLLSRYELKPIHWHIALDREGLGEFAFVSRKPGEEENSWPRPLGTERTLVCDTESRLLRYSWVTPDYILGGQMDHPGAVHSHLSTASRWQGITLRGQEGPRVFPTAVGQDEKGSYQIDSNGFCRVVQEGSVMLVQQSRRWSQVNPDWFPARDTGSLEYGIYFGDKLDRIVERGGWIFVEHGDAYLGVRVVMGEYAQGWTILADDASSGRTSELVEESYEWNPERTMVHLKDKFAGMIFEASRRAHHATLEAFIEDILKNPLVLEKTVVPGFHVLRYRGCGANAEEMTFNLANNEIPMLGGRRIEYAPDKLFDSPYLKSVYNSGIIEFMKGDMMLRLDMN